MLTPPVNAIPDSGLVVAELKLPSHTFPPVPTLLATRLQLQMLLAERPVDLSAASGIILNDLGATLEIFRRAGEEAGASCGSRMEDCLASLSTEAWMEAVCAEAVERTAAGSRHLAQLTAFWEHARSVGYACWLLAEHAEGICPEEAYLAGLLHEAAQLPALLGWNPSFEKTATDLGPRDRSAWSDRPGWTDRSEAAKVSLADHWKLPAGVCSLVASSHYPKRWRALLDTAHDWVDAACPHAR